MKTLRLLSGKDLLNGRALEDVGSVPRTERFRGGNRILNHFRLGIVLTEEPTQLQSMESQGRVPAEQLKEISMGRDDQ